MGERSDFIIVGGLGPGGFVLRAGRRYRSGDAVAFELLHELFVDENIVHARYVPLSVFGQGLLDAFVFSTEELAQILDDLKVKL